MMLGQTPQRGIYISKACESTLSTIGRRRAYKTYPYDLSHSSPNSQLLCARTSSPWMIVVHRNSVIHFGKSYWSGAIRLGQCIVLQGLKGRFTFEKNHAITNFRVDDTIDKRIYQRSKTLVRNHRLRRSLSCADRV